MKECLKLIKLTKRSAVPELDGIEVLAVQIAILQAKNMRQLRSNEYEGFYMLFGSA